MATTSIIVRLGACALLISGPAFAAEPGPVPETPVIMTGGTDTDPCDNGYVNLDVKVGGTLDVKTAPAANAAHLDTMYNGQEFYACQYNGDWLGIVYTTEKGKNCNTTTPWTATLPYTGPCRSGWVPKNQVHMYAG